MADSGGELEPFELERFFAKWEFEAEHLLCCSDCEPVTMASLIQNADEECLKLWNDLALGYTMSNGSDELRREVASSLYENLKEDELNIVVPEEGIYLSMLALLKKGDHVVVTYPGYQSLYAVAKSLGCVVHYWKPRIDGASGRCAFFVEDVVSVVEANPVKVVAVNFPHNPTGKTLTRAQHADLVSACERKGCHLFSDEMYRLLEYDEGSRLASAVDCYDKAVVLCGVSKSLSCPGLRIGWIASKDKSFLARLAELKDYTTICPSGPSEILALMAVRQRDRIVTKNLETIKANISALKEFCAGHAGKVAWDPPQAGSIAFPRLLTGEPVEAFCEGLARERSTLLLPASVYGCEEFTKDGRFRFGLGRENISEGLRRLGDALQDTG